ncbi:hypothetical protein B1218_38595, partial [Pseudomonas ogarae]
QGLLSPDAFIPLAEQTDLSVPLSRCVLREACTTTPTGPGALMDSVNLSPAHIERTGGGGDGRREGSEGGAKGRGRTGGGTRKMPNFGEGARYGGGWSGPGTEGVGRKSMYRKARPISRR